jgi:hypothetical protein
MQGSNGLKVISGGQTGVDRAALDAAMELGLEVGGFCPKGRRAEDGRIPSEYDFLIEMASRNYLVRTERNVVEADGTLILFPQRKGRLPTGTDYTRKFMNRHSKHGMIIELETADDLTVDRVKEWIRGKEISVLNVAGPKESGTPGIHDQSMSFLLKVFGCR